MRRYAIDLDLPKGIFLCRGVRSVTWRVSASGKGFHLTWFCSKSCCSICSGIERYYDDPVRHQRDLQFRQPHQRRILWAKKGSRRAGRWHEVKR